jgi:3',5'-cyclic AMP phosphodiesterase CpdA
MIRVLLAGLFVVVPVFGPAAAEPLRVAVISDLNGSYGSTDYAPRVAGAIGRIIELAPDLVLSTGDMVAGQRRDPHLSDTELRAMWRAFHAAVSEPLNAAGIPFAITPGNHDASAYAGFAHERLIYAEQWAERQPAVTFVDGGDWPFAYAFTLGGVLFVSLDATTVGPLSDAQHAWLQNVLVWDGEPHRLQVVFSHLPPWPFAQGREREVLADERLAPTYLAHGVDLHLSGHHHAYYPGMKDGIAYVSQACLGSGPRRLIGTAERAPHSFTMLEIEDDGRFEVYALRGPDYRRRIDPTLLPPRIVTDIAELVRRDLAKSGGE